MATHNKIITETEHNTTLTAGRSRVLLDSLWGVVPAILLAPVLATATPGSSQSPNDGPWLRGLSERFVVLDMSSADLDGDGVAETAVCYREPNAGHSTKGGIVVLKGSGSSAAPVFHTQLEAPCERVKISDGRLGVMLTRKLEGSDKLVWTYGKDLVFRNARNHPLAGSAVSASSSLRKSTHVPSAILDGDLSTSWAEGDSGTGIGETVKITLPRATDIAYIGIYGGHGQSDRAYYDHNRLHRASIKVRTADDMGDDAAGIDFADLGIDLGGERTEFALENQPGVHYVAVNKKGVLEIELRIESVYLGKTHDDTHIAELEIVPLLAPGSLVQGSTPLAQRDAVVKPTPASSSSSESKRSEARRAESDSLKVLDDGGRGLVVDDDDL